MPSAGSSPCRVVLVGMMGSGKTAVGRTLAGRTGWPYHDNDELLERVYGGSPRQLLAAIGEEQMHADEAAALRLGLASPAPCLVAAAAAAVLDPSSRARMKQAVVVWLRARPETLALRAVGAAHRPFLETDPLGWMTATVAERDPLYRALADISVDVDDLGPDEIADQILAGLAAFPACARLSAPS